MWIYAGNGSFGRLRSARNCNLGGKLVWDRTKAFLTTDGDRMGTGLGTKAGGGKDEMRKVEIGKPGIRLLSLIQIVSVPSVVKLVWIVPRHFLPRMGSG